MKRSFLIRYLPAVCTLCVFVWGVAGEPCAAHAAMSFCNRTAFAIEAALGYRSESEAKTETWTSEGWWRIEPGQCARVYSEPLSQRFYFYYAHGLTPAAKDTGPMEWSGKYLFCTDNKAFRVEGDKDCVSRKYLSTGFREIDVGTKTHDYSLDFKDPNAR